ncbi:xylulose kinase|uniref:Xylulokinase n=1 Tax=Dendrosporobacter quercicolus TaxID=146817 RepID=A0A1G9SV23_9FIRM|nr:FGGY family carbohydrate kinase [Dendrosporobacter quercicolus]NSL48609.1 xylulose kinase [Dendrosporobacter quercicolus DSM 1736]SDM39194.1 xylulokinase [Dendrosporobacter quercicolus]
MACLIGIDIGSTNCKAAAYGVDGTLKAAASRPVTTHYLETSWAEFDPDQIWQAVQSVLQEVAGQLGDEKIDGIAIASMGAAGVLLDENDRWIHRSIAWFDTRTEEVAQWWRDSFGAERIYEISGFVPNPMAGITKVQWIRDKMPETFSQVKRWVSMQDYGAYCLTGQAVVDLSVGCRTMAADLRNRCWNEEILAHAQIPLEICSQLKRSAEFIGPVTPKASLATGIPAGTPVFTGGLDYVCGAFACGLLEPGNVLCAIGTSEQILMVVDQPANDLRHIDTNFTCVNYVVNDQYYIAGQVISSGCILEWFAKEIAATDFNVLVEEAQTAPLGAKGVFMLPHFRGKYTPGADPLSKGAFVGLTTAHSRACLARAILEGLCYEAAIIMESMEQVADQPVRAVHVTGGATKSPFWMQMKADILGKPIVCLDIPEVVTLGAAMLAGLGAGMYQDSDDAVRRIKRREISYTPNEERHLQYRKQYEGVYKHLYFGIKDINRKIDCCLV